MMPPIHLAHERARIVYDGAVADAWIRFLDKRTAAENCYVNGDATDWPSYDRAVLAARDEYNGRVTDAWSVYLAALRKQQSTG